MSEEELTVFDILTRPDMKLSKKEKNFVKSASKQLLETLKEQKLVLDWRKRQQTRADVKVTIEKLLDAQLPEKYSPEIYEEKCELVYQHVYESYQGRGINIYNN